MSKTQLTDQMCDAFFGQQTLDRKQAVTRILLELDNAERKFPTWPQDIIHRSAIVQEEAGELTRAALRHSYENGAAEDLDKEAKQVAAMGLRFMLQLTEK